MAHLCAALFALERPGCVLTHGCCKPIVPSHVNDGIKYGIISLPVLQGCVSCSFAASCR